MRTFNFADWGKDVFFVAKPWHFQSELFELGTMNIYKVLQD
jgi:hypothetical protein